MAEYIEREALLDDIDAAMQNTGMGVIVGQTLRRYVRRQPTADVAEIRHGEWLEDEYNETTYCSECEEEALYNSTFELQFDYDWEENLVPCGYEEHKEYIRTKYCPNCGAKMDGDTNDSREQNKIRKDNGSD